MGKAQRGDDFIIFRASPELHAKLQRMAATRGASRSTILRELLAGADVKAVAVGVGEKSEGGEVIEASAAL